MAFSHCSIPSPIPTPTPHYEKVTIDVDEEGHPLWPLDSGVGIGECDFTVSYNDLDYICKYFKTRTFFVQKGVLTCYWLNVLSFFID